MHTRFTRLFFGVVAGAFFAVGCAVSSVGSLIGWLFLSAMAGTCMAMVATSPPAKFPEGVKSAPGKAGTLAGAGVFVVCVAVVGAVTVLGALSLLLFLVLAAAAAWSWRVSRRAKERPNGPVLVREEAAAVPEVTAIRVDDLTIEALCITWRRSYVLLQRASDMSSRDKIVQLRRCVLDELECRNRQGFTKWLESGARAGSDPTRYLDAS
jgi:hypothetical protein